MKLIYFLSSFLIFLIPINPTIASVIIISGSASGVGYSVSKDLLEKGHTVYGLDFADQTLQSTNFFPIKTDVSSRESVNDAVARVISEQGKIDVLVNNAGYGLFAPIEGTDQSRIQKQFETNVFGYANLQDAVLPYMRKARNGRIIYTSSVVGKISGHFLGWYAASKHAIEAVADALRKEVKPFGIDVIKIQPSSMQTNFEMTAFQNFDTIEVPEDYLEQKEIFSKSMRLNFRMSPGPRMTALTIIKAIEARNPSAVYRVGLDAKSLLLLKWILPEKLFDWIYDQSTKVLAKANPQEG